MREIPPLIVSFGSGHRVAFPDLLSLGQEHPGRLLLRPTDDVSRHDREDMAQMALSANVPCLTTIRTPEDLGTASPGGRYLHPLATNDFRLTNGLASGAGPLYVGVSFDNDLELTTLTSMLEPLQPTYIFSNCFASPDDKSRNLIKLGRLRARCVSMGYGDDSTALFPAAVALGASHLDLAPQGDAERIAATTRAALSFIHSLWLDTTEQVPLTLRPSEQAWFDNHRLALVAARDLEAGAEITVDDVTLAAPPKGMSPLRLNSVVGRRLSYALRKGDPITYGFLS